jgi:putative inorganic carbon (hco3(-)) transporter
VNERLAFGYGAWGRDVSVRRFGDPVEAETPHVGRDRPAELAAARPSAAGARREKRDWAFLGLLAFTAVLYFRPQDQIPGLGGVPLAELTAMFGLGAMISGRLSRGLTVTRFTPELLGVAAFGLVILLTAPFSVWPGGAVGTFTNTFVKVILIFVLMTNTLTTVDRLQRFMTIVVIATGYIGARAIFDYARGFNLVENGRVQGAVGGMFQNPNDLALNMVALLPLTVLVALRAKTTLGRLSASLMGLMMVAAVIVSYSRGGFVGMAVIFGLLGIQVAKRKPAMAAGAVLLLTLAVPLAPSSYWERVASITDDSKDATGSREARRILMHEAWNTFLRFPLHGVGAGMFQAYNPPERLELWRETHNVVLQVAAELGIVGLAIFGFLLWQAITAGRATRRLLRRATGSSPPKSWQRQGAADVPLVSADEASYLDAHAAAITAAVIGWFICALFASVAYSWTFYYLLALAVAPRDILAGLLASRSQGHTSGRVVGARA